MTRIEAEVIGTERLVLVPQRVEHAREMAGVLSDPALHTFIGGEPATADELRSRYARMAAGPADPAVSWCNWVIRLRESEESAAKGQLVGTVQATISPADPDDPADRAGLPTSSGPSRPSRTSGPDAGPGPWLVAEIAWVVGVAHQGRGIATEAARGLVGRLERRSVRDIAAHVHPDHAASKAVARAAGLEPTDEWHDGEVRWLLRRKARR
ncbi:GNAT family N-acetyltransferase [Streptomyces sp. NBC_01511]|uniref:GNAT family N-acetyltransferase n=1 Tax=unclassified Streptomyces TaxID=2593676 RepID=UPI003867B992